MIPSVYLIQSVNEIKDVLATNDATIQGILIAIILALGSALVFLYREKNQLQKEYVLTIKEYAENLRQVIDSNRETLQMMERMKG